MNQTTQIASRIVTNIECIATLASRIAARRTTPAKRMATAATSINFMFELRVTGGL